MENFIRIGHFVINIANVAYVSYEDDTLFVHFCAKGDQSLHLSFTGQGAKGIWEYFAKSARLNFD